jgi:hypothetical protein
MDDMGVLVWMVGLRIPLSIHSLIISIIPVTPDTK